MRGLCLFAVAAVTVIFIGVLYILMNLQPSGSALRQYFPNIAAGAVIFSAILYSMCVFIAHRLSENIVKPVSDIKLSDLSGSRRTVYPELAALVNKINAQGIEIERQLVKLKTRKTRFQTVSDNISEGLLTLDTDGTVLSVNSSGAAILGIAPEKIVHESLRSVISDPKLLSLLDGACGGVRGYAAAELDGKTHSVFFSPVFVNDSVTGIVMLIVDISEKAKSEALRQEFTANVSHELKTPLTTILGYSQIISRGIAKPEDVIGFGAKIEKEAARLITLIDDIIKLSRLDEGAPADEPPQMLSMRKIAEEAAEDLHDAAAKRGVTIEIEGDDFSVFGNMRQIGELVYNLCDNAIKYNKENGRVKIELKNRGITVSDTGIGIPDEYLDRIFERFFRVDKSRSKSVNGTGLGLSIVKHIAEAHDAEIHVESKVGEGTAVKVEFFCGDTAPTPPARRY